MMTDERTAETLRRLVNGFQVSQAVHVAAKLGIADVLADGPQSIAYLAERTGADEDALYRLMRALAAIGIFNEADGRTFSLTSLGECLRSDAPDSVAGWATFIGEPSYWRAWENLLHSVKTGEN